MLLLKNIKEFKRMFNGFTTIIVPNGVKSLERPDQVTFLSNYIIANTLNEAYESLNLFNKNTHNFVRVGIPVNNTTEAFNFIRYIRTELWNVNISVISLDRSEDTIEKIKKLKVNSFHFESCLSIV